MREEIRVLQDIYYQANKGVSSIERVCSRSSDPQLRLMLHPQREEYREIARTARRLLKARGVDNLRQREHPSMWSLPRSEQKWAERHLLACNAALEKSVQIIQRKTVDPKISALSRQLLLAQQAESAYFRRYLS